MARGSEKPVEAQEEKPSVGSKMREVAGRKLGEDSDRRRKGIKWRLLSLDPGGALGDWAISKVEKGVAERLQRPDSRSPEEARVDRVDEIGAELEVEDEIARSKRGSDRAEEVSEESEDQSSREIRNILGIDRDDPEASREIGDAFERYGIHPEHGSADSLRTAIDETREENRRMEDEDDDLYRAEQRGAVAAGMSLERYRQAVSDGLDPIKERQERDRERAAEALARPQMERGASQSSHDEQRAKEEVARQRSEREALEEERAGGARKRLEDDALRAGFGSVDEYVQHQAGEDARRAREETVNRRAAEAAEESRHQDRIDEANREAGEALGRARRERLGREAYEASVEREDQERLRHLTEMRERYGDNWEAVLEKRQREEDERAKLDRLEEVYQRQKREDENKRHAYETTVAERAGEEREQDLLSGSMVEAIGADFSNEEIFTNFIANLEAAGALDYKDGNNPDYWKVTGLQGRLDTLKSASRQALLYGGDYKAGFEDSLGKVADDVRTLSSKYRVRLDNLQSN